MAFQTSLISDTEYSYAESPDNSQRNIIIPSQNANEGIGHGMVASFDNVSICDMIKKTNDNFAFGKYQTLVARFHSSQVDDDDTTQTAYSKQYGLSHGRNLLKVTPSNENGYDNPYCRVWTYHHQYNQISKAIRPFYDANSAQMLEEEEKAYGEDSVGFRTVGDDEFGGGSSRLDEYGVLNYRNGMVNIAPTAKISDYFEHAQDDAERRATSTKRCMFSIENLAWRDAKARNDEYDPYGLSPEQRGPLGGRIMWFPPYDLQFSEDVSAEWNRNRFIGRGEDVLTYTNTERRGKA